MMTELREFVSDWVRDRETFPLPWTKVMMWIFILGDAFIFGAFLASYLAARAAVTAPWPDTGQVFALRLGALEIPLGVVMLMTLVLMGSSGTMALAVAYGFRGDRVRAARLTRLTALLGVVFLLMQAYEWTNLFHEGVYPWTNPFGAEQFGASFFMLTGFHGLHVLTGVVILLIVAGRVARGLYDERGDYTPLELAGLYWGFVDLVWVFLFTLLYLW